MLSATRKSWLLFAILALIALTSAFDIDGIEQYLHHGKRQVASGTGNSNTVTSETPQTTAAPTSEEPESTPTPTPTTAAPSSDEPSATPEPSSDAPASSAAPSSRAPASTPAARTSSDAAETTATPEVFTSAMVATSVQQFTTVFTTVSDGQSIAVTATSPRTNVVTTGQALITSTPTPNDKSSGDNGGGLSESNKKIIGGVVGGVGGAILLGGIAIVCWRIWGRKNRVSEDDDDLMAGTGSALGDKPQSGSTNTPFQSNLEQYHNPGGGPNAAANF